MGKDPLSISLLPELLIPLKALAEAKDLTVEELANRLLRSALPDDWIESPALEDQLALVPKQFIKGLVGKRFTDEGAKAYSQAARYEFQKHAALKGLDQDEALDELLSIALKNRGDIELINKILVGKHVLTGREIFEIIQSTGHCPMQRTLQDWSGDPLAALCKVFVDAIDL